MVRAGRLAALLVALAPATLWAPAKLWAQATGSQSNLVFGVAGTFSTSTSLWNVPAQPNFGSPTDTVSLIRELDSGFGLMFYGAYFPKKNWGLTGEVFFVGNGYRDQCTLVFGPVDPDIGQACNDIDGKSQSTSTVMITVGGMGRINARKTISPYLRAGFGLTIINRNSIAMQGVSQNGVEIFYPGETNRSVTGAVVLGGGFTARSKGGGYQIRLEFRDNIIGYDAASAASSRLGVDPPSGVRYRHVLSLIVGFDIVLEKSRGRRY